MYSLFRAVIKYTLYLYRLDANINSILICGLRHFASIP